MQKRENGDANGTLKWARWFLQRGFAIFPVDPQTKKAVVKGWQKYSTTPLSDEEKRQFLDMIAKGYNYAVPGGQNNLVILDFEDRELLKAWIGEEELNKICGTTLCVNTPHLGVHIYVIADEIPSRKFNPFFVKENKGVADLQSFNSYAVGPGSSFNHKHCDGAKCPFQGRDYTTQYTVYSNNEIGRFNLKQLLNFLAEKGKKLGIELSSSAREWIYEEHRMKREESRELKKPELKSVYTAVLPCFQRADSNRFKLVTHLSGFLARHKVKLEDAEALVKALYDATGLEPEHVNDVKYTYRNYDNGINVTGLPHLEDLCEEIGAPINKKLFETLDNENKKQIVGEKLIMSFDTLKIYHDFQRGKAYVSTYKAVLAKVLREKGKKVVEDEEPLVKIDKTFVNENGEVKVLTDDDLKKLKEEYLFIKDLSIDIKYYTDFNLPTEIKSSKISEVYKEVLNFVKQRVDTLRPEDQVAIAVWVIASYFTPVFQFFPYLAPMKLGFNAGGSQLLKMLKKIAPRAILISDITPAGLYRIQEKLDPVMLLDELRDNISKDVFNAIYDILVAGYMKGLKIPRVGEDREVELFEPFGAKAIIDQVLVTSQYDIASRCLFIRLIRNPNRVSDYSNDKPQDLINELYSVFLIYAPRAYSLYYYNMDSGYVGRYDQIFRPLVTIARLIDQEDETLRVEEQLKVILNDTQEYAEAFIIEGDPQRKLSSLVIEYIKDSLGEYMEGKSTIIPKPWHIYENGEDALYIFISDLRRKVSEYAMYLNQKDIEYKYGGEGKAAVSEREWEKLDPELAQDLGGRQFIGIIKKFFPNNVKEHRTKLIFIISRDGWNNLNFQNPPSRAETGGSARGGTPNSYLSQPGGQNTNTSNLTTHSPSFGSHFGSEKKIQNKGTEEENTTPDAGVLRDLPLQFSNKNSEPKTIDSAQFRLDFGSEIKFGAENLSRLGSEKIESAQPPLKKIELAQTPRQQRIYDFLKKLSTKKEARTALKKLSREEVQLLPELREKGYINFDDTHVWLTLAGYVIITNKK